MTQSDAERRIRARLPLTRFLNAYLPLSIAQWVIEKSAEHVKLPNDVKREAVFADGVACEWLIPENSPSDKILLYLHGGGFIYGLTSLHIEMVANLAEKMGIKTLMVDYRLAPKHPFPAALDDCVRAYHWLLKEGFSASNIVVAGDSAGGNLTITTLMKLRDDDDKLPAAAACLSPVADLTNKETVFEKSYDAVLHPRAAKFMRESYVANNDPHHPFISPIFGDWHGLPPLLIHAGEDEFLRNDAVSIEALIKEAGGEVYLEIYPRMWHVWQLYLQLPQTKQSFDRIAQFLKSHLAIIRDSN